MCPRICLCVLLCCSWSLQTGLSGSRGSKEATGQKSELGAHGRFADVSSLERHDKGWPRGAADEQGRAENRADGSCSRGIPISQLGKSTLLTQQLSEYSQLPRVGPLIIGYKFVGARNFGRCCCSGLFASAQWGRTGDFFFVILGEKV